MKNDRNNDSQRCFLSVSCNDRQKQQLESNISLYIHKHDTNSILLQKYCKTEAKKMLNQEKTVRKLISPPKNVNRKNGL